MSATVDIPSSCMDGSGRNAAGDGNLVTGQQQYSGAAAARLVIEALGR